VVETTILDQLLLLYCGYIQVAAYDLKKQQMDFFDPSRKDDFLFISGTKVLSTFPCLSIKFHRAVKRVVINFNGLINTDENSS
jgi:hypothetical protein